MFDVIQLKLKLKLSVGQWPEGGYLGLPVSLSVMGEGGPQGLPVRGEEVNQKIIRGEGGRPSLPMMGMRGH